MTTEIRRYVVECYYGKFWHFEKIVQSVMKKYDYALSEDEVQHLVEAVDGFLRSYKGPAQA